MGMKEDIILAIQEVADDYYSADPESGAAVKLALGTPNQHITVEGQALTTGGGWAPEPKTFSVFVEGLADYLTAQGSVPEIKDKLNELIAAFNQLRTDYNGSTVPTTAPDVDPLS